MMQFFPLSETFIFRVLKQENLVQLDFIPIRTSVCNRI